MPPPTPNSPERIDPHPQIRVVVLGDVRLYREGLAQLLGHRDTLHVVGVAPVVPEGLNLVTVECPDIVLVEAAVVYKRETLRKILEVAPTIKCIAYGIVDEEREAIECAEAGAIGYVSYEATVEDLVATILSAAHEEFSCSPRITAILLRRLSTVAAKQQDEGSEALLTVRERQVLALVDQGLSNKEIATRLGIEVSTVKNHMHNVLEKLHATCRGEAAARVRHAFLSPAIQKHSFSQI